MSARRGAVSHRSRTADRHARPRRTAAPSAARTGRPPSFVPAVVWRALLALSWIALGALAAVFAWREETSLDLGFHLATGRDILARHAWPRTDLFTYTVPTHPYIDMHGLFQIALAWAERAGGMDGIGVLRVACVLVALALVLAHTWRRGVRAPEAYACGVGLALCAWEMRFFARPELASYICLAAMLLALRRHAESGQARWLIAAPAVQLVWANAHALSLFGPAVMGAYAACDAAQRALPQPTLLPARRTRAAAWAPWLAFAATALALCCTPYGLEGVRFLWDLRTRLDAGNVFAGTISELSSPFAPAAQLVWPLRAIRVLVAVFSLGVLVGLRRASLFDIVIAAAFTWLACAAIRNIGLYVVAVTPLALQSAAAWTRQRRGGLTSGTRGRWPAWRVATSLASVAVLAALAVTVVRGSYYTSDRRPERFGSGASAAVSPIGCTDFVVAHHLRGPIYNHLNFGGYLIGRLWPGEKVFIDGRLEVIGEEFYRRYLGWNAGQDWDGMMAQYAPTLALVPYTSLEMLQRLAADPQWAVGCCDGAAVLFLRRVPANAAAIADAEASARRDSLAAARDTRIVQPQPRASALARLFGARRLAWEQWGRGNALYGLRRYDEAHAAYAEAVRLSPQDEPAQILNLAAAAYRLGRAEEAHLWYRRALDLDPRNTLAEDRLARLAAQPSR